MVGVGTPQQELESAICKLASWPEAAASQLLFFVGDVPVALSSHLPDGVRLRVVQNADHSNGGHIGPAPGVLQRFSQPLTLICFAAMPCCRAVPMLYIFSYI